MEQSKDKLAEQLAGCMRSDLQSFMKNLPEKLPGSLSAPSVQSSLLLNSDHPPPSCEMGEMMMKELLHPQISDTVLKVECERFYCHGEVLSSRCEYFSAMLKNNWTEANSEEITLNNIKPEAVAALLCFLYGASAELPKFCSLLDVLHIADMFGVTGLTDVAKHHIRTQMCHSFHKPCKDCLLDAPEVIQLASIFSFQDLLASFLKWNTKYFSKLWPTKAFASLQSDLRGKCVEAVVNSIYLGNAVHLLMETDKLLSSITRVQWTKPVVEMGTKLMTSCCDFIASYLLDLTSNKTIFILFQGIGWKTDIVERILLQIGDTLTVESVSNAHLAVGKLMYLAQTEEWIEEFVKMLSELKKKIWAFLVSNYFAVIHTEAWQKISSSDKVALKSETLCQGDENRKLSKRPVLSSSLCKKPPKPSVLRRRPTKPQQRNTTERRDPQQKYTPSQNNQWGEPPPCAPIITKEELVFSELIVDTTIRPQPLVIERPV